MDYGGPWEWVEGDAKRSAQYALAYWISLGIGAVLVVLLVLNFVPILTSTPSTSGSPFPSLLLWELASVLIFVTGVTAFRFSFQSRYPIVARLGISPVGVRLKLPIPSLRAWNVGSDWADRPVIGSDWIGIRILGILEKYRLTDRQMARLRSFADHPASASLVLPLLRFGE